MSESERLLKLIQQTKRTDEQTVARATVPQDPQVADDSKDYVRALENWAQRTNQRVEILVERSASVRDTQPKRIVAKIQCSATPSCICAQKLAGESIAQCKQRAARNFLQLYRDAPFTARR